MFETGNVAGAAERNQGSFLITASADTYRPVCLAFSALARPRAMNACRARRASTLRTTEFSRRFFS